MIGVIFVTLLVVAIVGSYMALVNRMLRSDEHWSETNQVKRTTEPAALRHGGVTQFPAHA